MFINRKELNIKKAIIIIGGSELQLPVIKWAKELGLFVIVTDYNKNVPGLHLADQFVNIDGTDIHSFLELSDKLNKKFDLIGAYGGSDFALPVVASINEAYNLKGPHLEIVNKALDKGRARSEWIKTGISIPKGITTIQLNDAEEFCRITGYPTIVKPSNSSGSRGVSTVYNHIDLIGAFELALSFSEQVVIEELVEGRHIDINGLFFDGKLIRCGADERFFSQGSVHLPIILYQPADISQLEENLCYQIVEEAAYSLGIQEGPVKADLILPDDGEPVIIELAPRFHGEVTTVFTTPKAMGFNPVKAYLSIKCGNTDLEEFFIPRDNIYAGWYAIFPNPGVVKTIKNKKHTFSVPGIYKLIINIEPGDIINEHFDNRTVSGFIFATGKSLKELKTTLNIGLENLSIITE